MIFGEFEEQQNITSKVLSNASGPLLRYDVSATPGQPGPLRRRTDPLSLQSLYGRRHGERAWRRGHDTRGRPSRSLAGHDLRASRETAGMYQSNEVPNVAEMITRRDDHRIDWPPHPPARIRHLRRGSAGGHAPFASGAITNIANGPRGGAETRRHGAKVWTAEAPRRRRVGFTTCDTEDAEKDCARMRAKLSSVSSVSSASLRFKFLAAPWRLAPWRLTFPLRGSAAKPVLRPGRFARTGGRPLYGTAQWPFPISAGSPDVKAWLGRTDTTPTRCSPR